MLHPRFPTSELIVPEKSTLTDLIKLCRVSRENTLLVLKALVKREQYALLTQLLKRIKFTFDLKDINSRESFIHLGSIANKACLEALINVAKVAKVDVKNDDYSKTAIEQVLVKNPDLEVFKHLWNNFIPPSPRINEPKKSENAIQAPFSRTKQA